MPVEVVVCCSGPGSIPPNQMSICDVSFPASGNCQPTSGLYTEIADKLVDMNTCGFPCNGNVPTRWTVVSPCGVKKDTVYKDNVPWTVFKWCCDEPCYRSYDVTCDDFGHITKTRLPVNDDSCQGCLNKYGPNCVSVCGL